MNRSLAGAVVLAGLLGGVVTTIGTDLFTSRSEALYVGTRATGQAIMAAPTADNQGITVGGVALVAQGSGTDAGVAPDGAVAVNCGGDACSTPTSAAATFAAALGASGTVTVAGRDGGILYFQAKEVGAGGNVPIALTLPGTATGMTGGADPLGANTIQYAKPGTTSRSVAARLGDVLSVKDYGAVGDGTTNDATAIQAAITAAQLVDGVVFFPCGTYYLTSALTISGTVTLQGDSEQCSILKMNSTATCDVVNVTSTASDVGFRDLTIDANAADDSDYSGIRFTSSTSAAIDGVVMDHVTVKNAGGWGVTWGNLAASAVSNMRVTNSSFYGSGGPQFGGLTSSDTLEAENLVFANNVFGSTDAPVLLTDQVHISLFIGHYPPATARMRHVTVTNNLISAPLISGHESGSMVIVGTDGVTIAGNSFLGPPGENPFEPDPDAIGQSLEVQDCDSVAITGNYFGTCYKTLIVMPKSGGSGGDYHATFSGNVVNNPYGQGLDILAQTIVQGNYINSAHPITVSVSDVVVQGNTIRTGDAGWQNFAVQLSCVAATCYRVTIAANSITTVNLAGGIEINDVSGSSDFVWLKISGNNITTPFNRVPIYSYATTGSALVDGNTISGPDLQWQYYQFPSGYVLQWAGAGPTTYTGSTSGTAVWSMPEQGSGIKRFVIYFAALNDAGGSITYPVVFSHTPHIYGDAACVAVMSSNTTTLTLGATGGISGYCFVEGN